MKYTARIRLDLVEYGVLLNKTTVLLESYILIFLAIAALYWVGLFPSYRMNELEK